MFSKIALCLGVSISLCISAWGQELTDREKKLMSIIESLEKRVTALEEKFSDEEPLEKGAPSNETPSTASTNTAAPTATPASAPAPASQPDGNDMRVYWKEGLRLDSHNGAFKLKFGGRIQSDWFLFSEGDEIKTEFGDSKNGSEIRRARIFIGGTIYDDFEFKAQYDFDHDVVSTNDLWISAKNVPVLGTIKFGHFKEPFGLERLTSSKDDSFAEEAVASALGISRNLGVQVSNSAFDQRLAWAVGVFEETLNLDTRTEGNEGISITGRISGLPLLNEKGDRYLHLGLSASHRNINEFAKASRAETHASNVLAIVSFPETDTVNLLGSEIAYTRGPLHLSGEFNLAFIHSDRGYDDADLSGFYAQAGYFLTGEHRRYKMGSGFFDKVIPKNNFTWKEGGGKGAWEVVTRYSHLDLEDNMYTGGELNDISLGLNWYLNPNMRVILNYVHAELDDGLLGPGKSDTTDAVVSRIQVTW